MKNFEKITESIERLAPFLLEYDDGRGEYYTTDGEAFDFDDYKKAVMHEKEWLKKECDESDPIWEDVICTSTIPCSECSPNCEHLKE